MAKAEQDRDLVLGNKQLLSAFFVVVVLLGVFFTAGYSIGRNTGPKSAQTAAAATDASANASPASEAALRAAARIATPAPTEPEPEPVRQPAAETHPAQPDPAPAGEKQPTRNLQAATAPTTKPAAEPLGAVSAQVTPGHQYLQLMAVKRPVADNMVKLLKGRGYPALLGESSKPELFRVLVGPFTDIASLAKTKAGLKAAGFDSVIAK